MSILESHLGPGECQRRFRTHTHTSARARSLALTQAVSYRADDHMGALRPNLTTGQFSGTKTSGSDASVCVREIQHSDIGECGCSADRTYSHSEKIYALFLIHGHFA